MSTGLLMLLLSSLAAATSGEIIYQGCWINANTAEEARAMPFRVAGSDFMSPDLCRRLAMNRGVSIYGLEWGRECWVDPDNGNLATLTRYGASTNCTMPCSGSTARCGGSYVDDVYVITDPLQAPVPVPNYSHLGCYTDDQLDRRMTLLWASNSSMTIDMCASIAAAEEHAYFALQWSRECWGGHDLNSSMSLGPSTACVMPCPGNANQTCGGALALNMFEVVDKYWQAAGYASPWDAPPPAAPVAADSATPISLLAGSNCTGAAASSAACQNATKAAADRARSGAVDVTVAAAACKLVAAAAVLVAAMLL